MPKSKRGALIAKAVMEGIGGFGKSLQDMRSNAAKTLIEEQKMEQSNIPAHLRAWQELNPGKKMSWEEYKDLVKTQSIFGR